MKRLSPYTIDKLKKFCATHPKKDAVKLFNLTPATIGRYTKGINWRKREEDQEKADRDINNALNNQP